ncbi:DUF2306 domain-containing protein [Novosphingobium sp.]|uniref:DUF2306 domain-containing protein n=1 Tax=Novosphingobium sp. TaxID=1874826 RepID=UPI002619B02C|nr:DUF2306 domain-containing protein [Novosphingobium sp.]
MPSPVLPATPASAPSPPARNVPPSLVRRFVRGELQRPAAVAAIIVSGAIGQAMVAHLFSGQPFWPSAYGAVLAIHIATVTPALPLGAWLLLRAKGTHGHRLLGRVWALLMLVTALTSFGITDLTGHFSPIHLLSILTIVSVLRGIRFARRGDIASHQRAMVLAFTGLVAAAVFTLLPGRLLGSWLLG